MSDSKNTSGIIPIEYVAKSVLNRLNQSGTDRYEYYLQLVIDGYMDLNLFVTETGIKVAYLKPDERGVITVPRDYVDYTKVMTKKGGSLYTLGLNKNYVPADEDNICKTSFQTVKTTDVVGQHPIAPHYYHNQYRGGLYALGGGFASTYFRVVGRQIKLSSSIPDEIILEYASIGISMCGETLIPREVVPALREYVMWQSIKDDDGQPESRIARKKQDYLEEEAKLLDFVTIPRTSQEILDTLYKTTTLTAKR